MGFANVCRKNGKVIVITSLVWCMLDVALLSYLSTCTTETPESIDHASAQLSNLKDPAFKPGEHKDELTSKKPSLFDKLIDNIPKALQPGKSYPGDGGYAVNIPADMKEKSKTLFKVNQFNLVASDLMSLNRTLPDYRLSSCKSKSYTIESLPSTSVIIVFHNEAWSALLRTVHSVIYRSPRHLLHEIIMVDDASTQDHLKSTLDDYVAQLPVKVTIVRIRDRGGLIRARLRGAKQSSGKVLTFLDAHCECTEGWLEPLMNEIYKDRTSVVCPIIDVISDDSFQYIAGSDMTWGGFNWKLNFRWYSVPSREVSRRGNDHSIPLRSPTMAGGLFAIEKDYFYEMGSYDSGMNIWGGENLEMSFRIWQCGGQVLIVTCSRVGHVFRKVSPYTWPGGVAQILNHNTQRIADVWMDEYSEFYYKINPGVKNTDPGDMTERKKLREKLGCKSFKWYLENIYPESNLPFSFVSLGQIKNPSTGECLDTGSKKAGELASLFQCHGLGGNQAFSVTGEGRIQADDLCVSPSGSQLKLDSCHGREKWIYIPVDKQLQTNGKCLSALDRNLSLEKCILGKPSQVWELENYKAV